jgi:hypothetical protein
LPADPVPLLLVPFPCGNGASGADMHGRGIRCVVGALVVTNVPAQQQEARPRHPARVAGRGGTG